MVGVTDENEASYGLVMPFVVTQSHGGPYEDSAFVAGYALGQLASDLMSRRHRVLSQYVRTQSLAQADLIAMLHGYGMRAMPWDHYPDEWAWCTFTRLTALDRVRP